MSEVISILKGGLGNQLFIYACGRAMALRTRREFFIDCIRGFQSDSYGRAYRLDKFPITAKKIPGEWKVAPTLGHWRHKWIRAWNKYLPPNWRSYIAEKKNTPATQITNLRPRRSRVTLNGYWQCEDYFTDHADAIRRELTPPIPSDERNRELGQRLASNDAVFVHVRRVRYPNLLPAKYYQEAIDEICQKQSQPQFAVFGDDVAWARANLDFHGHAFELAVHNADDEVVDLWLMTRCRHGIMANSSFSWWGAWLRENQTSGLTYAPKESGFGLAIPARWKQLSVA